MTRRYIEDPIQASIVQYLRTVLLNCQVFSIPNGGFRTKREAARLKWTGALAGVPDLAIVAPAGRVHFIECKALKGVLSDEQKAFRDWCISTLTPCAVCRSIDEVKIALRAWGLETREAA